MKKTSATKNSKKQNLDEDSGSDSVQHVKRFEDTKSFVSNGDKLKNYLQNSLLCKGNECHSDSDCDCLEKAQYQKKERVCGYCRTGKHSVNDCPLFTSAIEQQSNMLHTYKTSSSNNFKQLDHFTHDVYENTRKLGNTESEAYSGTDQEYLKLMQQAQEEYYSKRCTYCKEYGHLVKNCVVLEKPSQREFEDWKFTEAKKSEKSKKNKVFQTEIRDLSKIDYTITDCTAEIKENDFLKYCHYCKENGHIENICPLVQKALKKQKGKHTIVLPKIHKKDVANALAKVIDFRKLKECSFCRNTDHKDDDCAEKKKYFKKHDNSNEQVQLKDMCPSLEEDVRKLENHKFYINGQLANNDLKKKTKLKHVKTSNKCNFCKDSDHSESECEEKLQYEYISKYCQYCDEYGHFEDKCALVEAAIEMKHQSSEYCKYCEEFGHLEDTCQLAQVAKEMENQSGSKNSLKNSKRVSFSKDVTSLTENLIDLKRCHICDEFGHDENDCFVKQQAEFYRKYCDLCKENGHYDKDCTTYLNKQSSNSNAISNNVLKKELQARLGYVSICSEHYVCEDCHNVYSNKQNSNETDSENKIKLQSSSEANANSIRYCTLCGIQGLINTCILKEKSDTE